MINGNGPSAPNSTGRIGARNLTKNQLGGVIFGCTNSTIRECLSKQLFGLPAAHFSYVKNIDPGLPLFLFNYSDRKLYGTFEAASHGQLNINPYGWTADGSERTQYPAQVQVRVRLWCQPLLEEQFRPIIADNYYSGNHFWFELDHAQTNKLMSSLASLAVAASALPAPSTPKCRTISQPIWPTSTREEHEGLESLPLAVDPSDHLRRKLESTNAFPCLDGVKEEREGFKPPALELEHSLNSSRTSESSEFTPFDPLESYPDAKGMKQDDEHLVLMKLEQLAHQQKHEKLSLKENTEGLTLMNNIKLGDTDSYGEHKDKTCSSLRCQSVMSQLIHDIEELKAFKTEHTLKTVSLEQKLVEAEREIQWLKDHRTMSESVSKQAVELNEEKLIELCDQPDLDTAESVLLVGGYDGQSWLSALDSYFPSHDMIKSLKPMNSVRSYASVARLDGELYVFGGGNGYLWYDTVESYSQSNNQWTVRPSLNEKKGSLAGATINGKIFAVGGGNGCDCFSDVEMLDLDVGRWICTRSMLQKRFAVAVVELNGALYATGGYDGNDYLNSAERFDPREHSWTKIASMTTKRGCHSLVILNQKLYALGGFDGLSMVPTVEIYDPRLDSWMSGEPMNQSRGYAAAAALKDSIYVIGGLRIEGDIVDTVEIFKESEGWQEKNSKAVQKRCFASASYYPVVANSICIA